RKRLASTRRWGQDQRADNSMRALVLIPVALIAGCGGRGGDTTGTHPSPCPTNQGVLLLSWTVHGMPPTADQGCSGIANLIATLDSACASVEIEPIPCINGPHWLYEPLPGGATMVVLTAFDARQRVVAHGAAEVAI